jgi:hypothetical protein
MLPPKHTYPLSSTKSTRKLVKTGELMNPTHKQTERLKVWLDARLSALFAGRPFPSIPPSIESDLHNALDFSNRLSENGFAPDGLLTRNRLAKSAVSPD